MAILREAARSGTRVVFTNHVIKRLRERRILRTQVLRCLANGKIVEGPTPGLKGDWQCRVEGVSEGRGLGVAVAIAPDRDVIVITAFWIE